MEKITSMFLYGLVVKGLVVMLAYSCKKADDTKQVPVLSTSPVSDITVSTAAIPTLAGNKTSDGAGAGSITSTVTGLSESTSYSVQAYATNNEVTGYGSAMSFAPVDPSPNAQWDRQGIFLQNASGMESGTGNQNTTRILAGS